MLETRHKVYPVRDRAKRERRPKAERPDQTKLVWVGDPGGVGMEIVREACACQDCAMRG